MNIITWNCNMAFRKKWHALMKYEADIFVIQECEHPKKYKASEVIPSYNQFLWFGENENKGVGIITFGDYHVIAKDNHHPEYRYIIPLQIRGPKEFDLYAVWAMSHKTKSKGYVGQLWGALQVYTQLENSIWIGDFNSNAIWNKERKNGNHGDVAELLQEQGVISLYHGLLRETEGEESQPTIYLLKNKEKPFHLDYCFAPTDMIAKHTTIEVGQYKDWIKLSDHMPIIISDLGN